MYCKLASSFKRSAKINDNFPGPLKSETNCKWSDTNPCYSIGDGTCTINQDNKSFEDMINNKINFTCDCHKEREGFRYHTVKILTIVPI